MLTVLLSRCNACYDQSVLEQRSAPLCTKPTRGPYRCLMGRRHCVVTSPPYFSLRRLFARAIQGIGLEPTLSDWLANIVAVSREVWRVLRDDGTYWLNLGRCLFRRWWRAVVGNQISRIATAAVDTKWPSDALSYDVPASAPTRGTALARRVCPAGS